MSPFQGTSDPPAEIGGVYFDGHSSRALPATLFFTPLRVRVVVSGSAAEGRDWPLRDVQTDPALAGIRRGVSFPDGSRFETTDLEGLGRWERRAGRHRVLSGVARLETRWSTAIGALVLSVAALLAFVVWGVPLLAAQAARLTPRHVLAAFDRETVRLLGEQHLIGPSRLSAARQAQLQREFLEVRRWAGGGYPYRLLLRAAVDGDQGVGANAFALPNGTIVMTDQLVALSRSDRELMGVLAHESAHVTRRHGVAAVYQALGLGLAVTAVTGDLVSASTFAAAVPAAVVRGGYSRAAEAQADQVAADFLMDTDGTTRPLQAILTRLSAQAGDRAGGDRAGSSWLDVLRSHPAADRRIAALKAAERGRGHGD